MAIDPSAPSTLYVASGPTDQPGRVMKSSDGGATWRESLLGYAFTALAIDPQAPATVYAGTAGTGVFKSINGGRSWAEMNAGLSTPYVNGLAIDPSTPARLYAATDGGVYEYLTAAEPMRPGRGCSRLHGGRFKVTVEWSTRAGESGPGRRSA